MIMKVYSKDTAGGKKVCDAAASDNDRVGEVGKDTAWVTYTSVGDLEESAVLIDGVCHVAITNLDGIQEQKGYELRLLQAAAASQ